MESRFPVHQMPDNREIRYSHAVLPARALDEGEGNTPMGPVTRKIKAAESALQQRVEFEGLVSQIASIFVTLRNEDLDWGIREALRQIGEFVGVDHAHVFRVWDDTARVEHTHEWSADGQPSRMQEIRNAALDGVFPWAAQRLRRLDGIAVYSVEDLGSEAVQDQVVFRRLRLKSVLLLPMAVGGYLVGFLGFDSTQTEIQWTQDAISLLNIVGAIIADALQRKANEDALRKEAGFTNALLNSSGAIFVVLDSSGRIVRFNPAAEEVTGFRFDEVYGRAPWDVFVSGHDGLTLRRAFKRLAAGAPPSQTEGSIDTRSGHRLVISWTTTALTNEAGDVEYVIFSGLDITEMRRLEAAVLDVAEREQSRFGHDLHDGLGQHLTGIEFMAQVLQQRLEAADHPEAKRAEEITGLIRQAIAQTRDLARGLSPVVLQSKGLTLALRDLAESVSKRHGISCQCEIAPESDPPRAETATHLYRIAQEAVNNALKHGKATTIVIRLKRVNQRFELQIIDNGTGAIPADSQRQGMGLRVMSYRAGIIGGGLEITQKRGEGTIVACRCP